MKTSLLILGSILVQFSVFGQQKVWDLGTLGAKGDGLSNNTTLIQGAIDQASAAGGGIVRIPAGRYLTSVLRLKSGVELHFDEGAVLLGSTLRSDYGGARASALLLADDQQNISLSGKGVIDGQGREVVKDVYRMLEAGTLQDPDWKTENPWHQKRPNEFNRPGLIQFNRCKGVILRGVTLKDAACWVQTYSDCTDVLFDSIRVESTAYWNNDGFDIVDCQNVQVRNCFVNAGDDGICLKSHRADAHCENVVIDNCTVRSSASAIKFGTASLGGFKNVVVSNIKVYDTYRSAIALESVDGGTLENITVQHIEAKNTGNAIFIRLGHRKKNAGIGRVSHILISDVRAEVPAGKPDKGYEMEGPEILTPHNIFPSSITGLPGYPVQDVTLENIELIYPGGGNKGTAYVGLDSLGSVPEKESDYPEFSMFGELPSWGFYVRHAAGIKFKNVTMRYGQDDFRPAVVVDDVQGLALENVKIPTAQTAPVVVLKGVTGFTKEGGKLPFSDKKAIRVWGAL